MEEIEIALPYPPSVNHYWRHTKQGRHYIAPKGVAFREAVYMRCRAISGKNSPLFCKSVDVSVKVFPPDNRRRDIDNILKALLDGLVHGRLLEDDSLIMKLTVEKFEACRGGMVVVKITER